MLPIAEQLTRELAERRLTIAAAESCTGGLIGHLLTDVPGSSKVFPGGVVAYANAPKSRVLGVDEALLREHGAVSAEAAAAMAEGVRRLLGTDIGIAATGIAGPTGGSAEKPVGTVFIAYIDAAGQTVERHQWTGEREENKQSTATAAIELVLRRLGG